MIDFVVGKHYRYGKLGTEYDCIYITPEGNAVFKNSKGSESFFYKTNVQLEEVKTPRKIKRYVGVFCDHVNPEKVILSIPYDTEKSCRHSILGNGWIVLDVITIDWVEKV